jgi:hypothetical protein
MQSGFHRFDKEIWTGSHAVNSRSLRSFAMTKLDEHTAAAIDQGAEQGAQTAAEAG